MMKYSKRFTAWLLALALVAGLVPVSLTAGAAVIGEPDQLSYNFPDVSGLDPNIIYPGEEYNTSGSWTYQYAPADDRHNYLDFDAFTLIPVFEPTWWLFSAASNLTKFSGRDGYDIRWQAPVVFNQRAWQSNGWDNVYTYTAPSDGVITIEHGATVFGDPNIELVGVRLTVYKQAGGTYAAIGPAAGGGAVYDAVSTGKRHDFAPLTTAIKAGETIRFQMTNNNTANGYAVGWDPKVTYTGLEYDPSLDLGLTIGNLIETNAFGDTFVNYTETGFDGWLYQSDANGVYTPLDNLITPYYLWTIGALWGGHPAVGNGSINPGWQYNAAVTYTASREGIIELPVNFEGPRESFESILDRDPGSDPAHGVLVAIYQNDTKIWPESGEWHLAERQGTYNQTLENIALKAGDKLHFRAAVHGGRPNHAAVFWNPGVKYTSYNYDPALDRELQTTPGTAKTKFEFATEYSGTQGKDNWYYLTSPQGGITYDRLEYVDTWGGVWGDADLSFNSGLVERSGLHAGHNYDPIIAFKAPYTGTISLSSASGRIQVRDSVVPPEGTVAGDGIEFGIFLRSEGNLTTLYPPAGEAAASGMLFMDNAESRVFDPMNIQVKKNQMIWVRVNNGPNNRTDHDGVSFQPVIEYLNYDLNDGGVMDEDEMDSIRADRPAGSNIKEDAFPAAARVFEGTAQEITAANNGTVLARFENGELEPGIYEIKDNRSFVIAGVKDKVYDFTGYKFIVTPDGASGGEPEKRFGLFAAHCENVTIKNLTIEVRGTPNEVIHGWDCVNVEFVNLEVIDKNNREALMSFGDRAENIIVDGLRFVAENDKKSFIWLGAANNNVTIKNSYLKDARIEANESSGVWIENNIIENTGMTGIILGNNGTAVYNSINITGAGSGINANNKTNVLAALNKISGDNSLDYSGTVNGVILKNELSRIYSNGGTNITVAENTFAAGGSVEFINVNYALGTNNTGFPQNVTLTNSTNLSGEDFNSDAAAPEVGANEALLPKLNKELFVGMPRRAAVNYGSGNTGLLNHYVNLQYNSSKYVIIPPGAYTSDTIHLSGYEDYTIYAYGVLAEFGGNPNNPSYATAVRMTNSEDIAVKGLYIDHVVPPNGQATVTGVTGSTITFKMDAGYNQNLLNSSHYALSGATSANIQWYSQNQRDPKLVSNIATAPITAVDAANGIYSISRSASTVPQWTNAAVGDKLGFRGRDVQTTRLDGCSNITFEDYTIYGSGGFGFMESGGNKATTLHRMAGVPGPAPLLADGSRGAARLISTCDSTHSADMREGPQLLNCLFESASDDGTNIRGNFGTVLSFDPSTRTITYTRGNNQYSNICRDFETGDKVMIYTKNGELLFSGTAASNTASSGNNRTVRVDGTGNIEVRGTITVIQNASATGNGFKINNTRLYGNWTKGFLIKASNGEITNSTMDSVGITAVYLCPELRDGTWSECGYSENVLISNNLIKNTGYMYSNQIYSTVINIQSDVRNDAGSAGNPDFMMMRDIKITGNVIEDRHTTYALNINGGLDILVENNNWGFMAGKDAGSDTQPSAVITTSMNIEMNGNIYPPLAVPKININSSATNVFGTDISAPIADIVKGGLSSAYNGSGWDVILTLENISDTAQTGTFNFNLVRPENLIGASGDTNYSLQAGEKAEFVYPVTSLPADLGSAQFSVIYTLAGETGLSGLIGGMLYFNAAVKTGRPLDWDKAIGITAAENADYKTELKFLWDDEYLYMKALVTDPSHSQPYTGGDIWNGDSIQFALEPGYFTGIPGQLELGFALSDDGSIQQWCWGNTVSAHTGNLAGLGFEANIERLEGENLTVYQIAMPWSFIGVGGAAPEDNAITAFNVCVNSRDTGTGRTWYEFYGGIAENKNASEFGLLSMYSSGITPEAAALKDALSAAAELLADVKTVLAKPRGTNITANLWANALTAFVPRLEAFSAAGEAWDGGESVVIDGITFTAPDVNNWIINVKNIYNLLNAIV